MQYVGLGFLFSLYLFQGLKFVLYDLPRENKREAAVKQEIEKVDRALSEAKSRSIVARNQSNPSIVITNMDAGLGTDIKSGKTA